MNVEEFKNWWIKSNRPLKVPFKDPIHDTDIACAIVLYRDGEFQVEMYICKPNKESTPHTHPHIDSINMYLTGDLTFKKGDGNFADLSEFQKPFDSSDPDSSHFLLGMINETNDGNTPHTLKINDGGGAFLIFQKWNAESPSSVAVVYDGESLGEVHDKVKRLSHVE